MNARRSVPGHFGYAPDVSEATAGTSGPVDDRGERPVVAGLAALALTLVGAVLLVLDIVVGRSFALWSAGALGALLIGLWFVLPLPLRERTDAEGADGDDEE